jgi:serine/threonine-protein kinase ATR
LNLAERWTVSLPASSNLVLPYATEAAWLTGKWDVLDRLLKSKSGDASQDFDVGIGKALLALRTTDMKSFESRISTLRTNVMRNFSSATTTSLASAHGHSLKLHALYEVAAIGGLGSVQIDRSSLFETLDRRLELLGALTDDKQYLLGLRRAAMQLSR